ncbi:MAG: aminoglycoside phosphotransferase family protein [Sphingomonas sp.]|nr:aminoglycoside phosphotransferase family protein [Sphingomonas sp.]
MVAQGRDREKGVPLLVMAVVVLGNVWAWVGRTMDTLDDRLDPTTDLVAQLVRTQFPGWANLPIRKVDPSGWDNRSFRLGDRLLVRLPSAPRYAPQVAREQSVLPRLSAHLPLAIPKPLAIGAPSDGFPLPWSIFDWIEGDPATTANIKDRASMARSLAAFLAALHRIDPTGGPPPGDKNFGRGGPLAVYADEVAVAIQTLADRRDAIVDLHHVRAIWAAAVAAPHLGTPVWVHGDIAPGNLIVRDGKLVGVIDFGQCSVGDPACDLAIFWTWMDADSRLAFRESLSLDATHWTRARGWALWKALILIAGLALSTPPEMARARLTLDRLTDKRWSPDPI